MNGNLDSSRSRNNSQVIVPVPMKYIVTDGMQHYHKTVSTAERRERMNQVQVKLGCNDKPKKLTSETLTKLYERNGRPFYGLLELEVTG
jgi:hypothetical protein